MLRKLRQWVYLVRSRGTDNLPDETEPESDTSEDDGSEVNLSWPPNDCVEIPDTSGEETIELRMWARDEHHEYLKNARPYVEYAFADAFGDRYNFDVTVSDTRLPEEVDGSNFNGWLWKQDDMVKDGNICVFQDDGTNPPGLGGGYTAYYAEADKLKGFDPDCIKQFGYSDAHFAVNIIVMELGHCLGLSHNGAKVNWKGNKWSSEADSFVTPMSTGYIDAQGYYHDLWKGLHDKELQVE